MFTRGSRGLWIGRRWGRRNRCGSGRVSLWPHRPISSRSSFVCNFSNTVINRLTKRILGRFKSRWSAEVTYWWEDLRRLSKIRWKRCFSRPLLLDGDEKAWLCLKKIGSIRPICAQTYLLVRRVESTLFRKWWLFRIWELDHLMMRVSSQTDLSKLVS